MARTPSNEASIERMIDISNFCIAYSAFQNWVSQNSLSPDDDHLNDGVKIFKRYYGAIESSLIAFIEPLLEKATILKPKYNLALNGDMKARIGHCADLFEGVFKWIRAHTKEAGGIYEGRAKRASIKITQAVFEENLAARLNQCAAIPSISAANVLRRWIEVAAEKAGAPITNTESIMADSESANVIAEKLRLAETKVMAIDPVSADAAEAQEDKRELVEELENLSETSKKSDVVMSAVTTTMSQSPVSKVATRMKLDSEKIDAMLAEGRLVINAGAGAGKSTLLVAKIAYMVEEKGFKPEEILATSFTNKSAAELRERVKKQGVPVVESSNRVGARIDTTHSIANTIIQDYGTPQEKKGAEKAKPGTTPTGGSSPSICDKLLTIAIRQVELTKDAWFKVADDFKKPFGKDNPTFKWNLGLKAEDERGKPIGRKRIATMIGNLQTSRLTPEQAEQKLMQGGGRLGQIVSAIYSAYEWLKKNHPYHAPALDYNDWLNTAVDILERDKSALNSIQRRWKAVLVDESQDLNETQYKLFNLIGQNAKVMAFVGDDKQAIYEFRGATPKEFINLRKNGYTLKTLTRNYRSGKNIVDAANRLIAHNEDRQIPMVCEAIPDRENAGTVLAQEYEDHESAAYEVAEEISSQLKAAMHAQESGVEITAASPKDFGILVRNNAEKDAYEIALIAKGIPFRSSGAGYFNREQVKGLTSWMVIAAIPSGGVSNEEIADAVFNAHRIPGYFLSDAFKEGLMKACPRGMNYFEYLTSNPEEAARKIYGGSWNERQRPNIIAYAYALKEVYEAGADSDGNSSSVIEKILGVKGPRQKDGSSSSFKDALVAMVDPDDIDADETKGEKPTPEMIEYAALASLRPLMEMAHTQTVPGEFMSYVKKLKAANAKTRKADPKNEVPAVRLDTVHQWKGLESKHVYVCMADGVFPHGKSKEAFDGGDKEALDSERRLAYVAITRGEDSVKVVCPKRNYLGKEASVSRFVSEACIKMANKPQKQEDGMKTSSAKKRVSNFGRCIANAIDNADIIEDDEDFDHNI